MSDYSELKRLAEAAAKDPNPWFDEQNQHVYAKEDRQFIAAAEPQAILALIAENERLRESHEQICGNYNRVSFASEERGKQIDQLKAENERLQASLQGYQMGAKAEAEEADRLRGEVKELRKDAERWRYVRSPIHRRSPYAVWKEGTQCLLSQMADEAIDAAMAKEARP